MSSILCLSRPYARGKSVHLPRTYNTLQEINVRNRLSKFWTPTSVSKQSSPDQDVHSLLIRAGFLRQSSSGIFHLLPLGLRVQDKIERLIDKHMQRIGASKVALSSLSSQDLWRKSGRLEGRNAELFKLRDRKDAPFLLAPTHEEEITAVVKDTVHSYRDLPVRLYQVTRKYRDELRPRQGLLRGREFVMKDLYTFDENEERAMETYRQVGDAYRAFLDEFNLPYVVANADSGNMGGNHSHEYHFVSDRGEDTIIGCNKCGLSINDELYIGNHQDHSKETQQEAKGTAFEIWTGRSVELADAQIPRSSGQEEHSPKKVEGNRGEEDDRTTKLVHVFIPDGMQINLHALKKLVPNLETGGEMLDQEATQQVVNKKGSQSVFICDPRVASETIQQSEAFNELLKSGPAAQMLQIAPFLLTKAQSNDRCPNCNAGGTLSFQRAVEIGHTFHLGKRYSGPLDAVITDKNNQIVEVEMGCHGIGVSRLIGTMAALLTDEKGLNWPAVIAPYGVLLVDLRRTQEDEKDVDAIYDRLTSGLAGSGLDIVIDDRDRPAGWKLNDADLIGYPFIAVLGKAWVARGEIELQCRRLGIKETISVDRLLTRISECRKAL